MARVAAIARKTTPKAATDALARKLWLNVPPRAPTGALARTIAPNNRDHDRGDKRADKIHAAQRGAEIVHRNGVLQRDLGERCGRSEADADQKQDDFAKRSDVI